jgi:hypothetical protein
LNTHKKFTHLTFLVDCYISKELILDWFFHDACVERLLR